MTEHGSFVDVGEHQLPATLSIPRDPRGGVVTMHPAASGDRNYFLLAHVAHTLVPEGIAVLRYDRRPAVGFDDVPFSAQAADALGAIALLREHVGEVPIGLWGYSQGTWAASLAAADAPDEVAFLVLLASPGVSPAEQMRYGTTEQLVRNGFGPEAIGELVEVRDAVEGFLRGAVARTAAQAAIDRYATRGWFLLTHYPTHMPEDAAWTDMDFDPGPVVRRVRCPVLLVYGSDDEWTPVEPSLQVWRTSGASITIEVLPGRGHAPVIDDSGTMESVDPAYQRRLVDWLRGVLG